MTAEFELLGGIDYPGEPFRGSAAEFAAALLFSVIPTDRALAGWAEDPAITAAMRTVAQRPPGESSQADPVPGRPR